MKKKKSNLISFCIFYTIIPLSVFFLFKKLFDWFLDKALVSPFFSACSPKHSYLDMSLGALCLLALFFLLRKIFRGAKIETKWALISFTLTIIYFIYRKENSPFSFTETSFSEKIKLADFLLIFPLTIIICCLARPFFNRKRVEKAQGFLLDEPTIIKEGDDLLDRSKFVNEIVNKIETTNTIDKSFSMGILGPWGSGKTTVLKTIASLLDEKKIINFELNVWKCSNSNQIIEALFKLFRENLGKFSFSINNKLNDYAESLLKSTKNDGLAILKNVSEIFFPHSDIGKQYDVINSEIQKIERKIVVLIDDLDRLDKDEIYEVIRLIRNTASFSNTFFIVAYDRNYILPALEKVNSYQSHYYLEKIFQIEFTLPPITAKIIQHAIEQKLEIIISKEDFSDYKILSKGIEGYGYFNRGNINLTELFIQTIRDVTRFINSLAFRYSFLNGEVYFPDFYNLELIRFKHPDFLLLFYREHSRFLETLEYQNGSAKDTGVYHLRMTTGTDGKSKETSILEEFILKQSNKYKFDESEVRTLTQAFLSLFPHPENRYNTRYNGRNGHLSVLLVNSFDRYFRIAFGEMLSEKEFAKMIELPTSDLLKAATHMVKDENSMSNLYDRLTHITTFSTKEQFEKIITLIFYFASLPYPNPTQRSGLGYIGFNGEALAKVLGDKKVLQLYDDQKEKYKEFLTTVLSTDSVDYNYVNDFTNLLQHHLFYYVENLFTIDEITTIIYQNYFNALQRSDKITMPLWWHFGRCEIREEKVNTAGYTEISYPKNPKALKTMRKFIWDKDMDTFILYSIYEVPFDKAFTINENVSLLFKSYELFAWLLNRYSGISNYKKEFLELYKAISANKKSVPKDFFKIIPVKLQHES